MDAQLTFSSTGRGSVLSFRFGGDVIRACGMLCDYGASLWSSPQPAWASNVDPGINPTAITLN